MVKQEGFAQSKGVCSLLALCSAVTVECSQVLRSFHFHFRPRAVGSGTTSVTVLLKNTGSVPPLFTVNTHQVLAVL
jgi:hypothetical protein